MTSFSRFLEIENQLRSSSDFGQHRCMTCCPELRPKLTDEERERLAAWDRHVSAEDAKAAVKGCTNLWHPPAEIRALKAKARLAVEKYEIPEFLRENLAVMADRIDDLYTI